MDAEDRALKEAERRMDLIFKEAKALPEQQDDDDWQPSPLKYPPQRDWQETLARLDRLQERLDAAATHK